MRRVLVLQMWEPMRQTWMAEHRFYVEQARKRLLTQFEGIEKEADAAAEEHLATSSAYFDPDLHDVGDAYEAASDAGLEFYRLLSEMRERTLLSIVAGMYHEWDKKLREWLVKEVRHNFHGRHVSRAIWKADFPSVFDLLLAFGFDARKVAGHERLDALRLVVNVFKHGDGPSFDDLKKAYPEFIEKLIGHSGRLEFLGSDYTDMTVTTEHLDQFSEAILSFWQAVPIDLWVEEGNEFRVPDWFEKAVRKDAAAESAS